MRRFAVAVVGFALLAACSNGTTPAGGDGAAGTQGGAGQGGTCAFATTYLFGDDGGFRAYSEDSTLTPPRTHAIERVSFSNGSDAKVSCARQVPCATVAAVEAAVANADVQAALAKAPGMVYGTDPRPVDGTVFKFTRGDRSFFVGGGDAVPAGLRALETLLRTLQGETRADPACDVLGRAN